MPGTRTSMFIALTLAASLLGTAAIPVNAASATLSYPIVDTGQQRIFSNDRQLFFVPKPGDAYFGEDGQYRGAQPAYRDNGDGTVTDLVTGLMWQKAFTRDVAWSSAASTAKEARTGGYADWRVPTIKELYSLILFTGSTGSSGPSTSQTPADARPYLDSKVFDFEFPSANRYIDAQYISSTAYLGTVMHGQAGFFGVNFADGRIKGYPQRGRRDGSGWYLRLVRGNPQYGRNHFTDNGDGTVNDAATGLMWQKGEAPKAMKWKAALSYCSTLDAGGYSDWRLPNVKELQSLVDYGRAPEAADPAKRGPAIDPLFTMRDLQAWDWSSTTHFDGPGVGARAAYIAFGRATGYLRDPYTGERRLLDVHGAGAQRSDPKDGDPNDPRWSGGFGPQGDVNRIENSVRCVRNIVPGTVALTTPDMSTEPARSMPRGRPDGRGPDRDMP